MGVPQMGCFIKKNRINMDDDWRYPYFRKPPKITLEGKPQFCRFLQQQEVSTAAQMLSHHGFSNGWPKGESNRSIEGWYIECIQLCQESIGYPLIQQCMTVFPIEWLSIGVSIFKQSQILLFFVVIFICPLTSLLNPQCILYSYPKIIHFYGFPHRNQPCLGTSIYGNPQMSFSLV